MWESIRAFAETKAPVLLLVSVQARLCAVYRRSGFNIRDEYVLTIEPTGGKQEHRKEDRQRQTDSPARSEATRKHSTLNWIS